MSESDSQSNPVSCSEATAPAFQAGLLLLMGGILFIEAEVPCPRARSRLPCAMATADLNGNLVSHCRRCSSAEEYISICAGYAS